jgi:hypothetical protein
VLRIYLLKIANRFVDLLKLIPGNEKVHPKITFVRLENLLYFAINARPNIGTVDCRKIVEVAALSEVYK